MKPRTKIQKQVIEMANALPPATTAQREWAFSHLFKPVAKYYKKGEVWCLNCGHIEPWGKESELAVSLGCCEYTCPHCGAKLTMEHWKGSAVKNEEMFWLVIPTTYKGWQVMRTYEVERRNRRGKRTERTMREIFQRWISSDGKEVIASKAYSRTWYYLKWYYDSPFEIKRHNGCDYSYSGDLFDLAGVWVYPHTSVSATLKRNGWSNQLFHQKRVDPADAMRLLLTSSDAETAVKTGQVSVFRYMALHGDKEFKHRKSLNICNRNGYIIEDAQMWVDYINMLVEMDKDIHNAHYVCPADLKKAHDKAMKKVEKVRAIRRNAAYVEAHKKYLGLTIVGGGITIRPLQSVEEFFDEGKKMHHCVAGYYTYDDSLILTARDEQNKRLETIELSLKTFKVVQCHGKFNKNTKRHQQILDLIKKNIRKIRQAV